MLATARLLLRPYTDADLDDLVLLRTDPRVHALMTTGEVLPSRHSPQLKKRLRLQMERAAFAAILRCRDTGVFVGQVLVQCDALERQNRDGTYGVCLVPTYWNRGYGSEVTAFVVDHVFRWLGLQRLSLNVFVSNARAVAVYEKAGFVVEGRKRACIWSNDHWEDVLLMGVLRDEWIKRVSILEQ